MVYELILRPHFFFLQLFEIYYNYIDAVNFFLLIYEKIRINAKYMKRKKKLKESLMDNGESFQLSTYLSLQNK